MRGKKEKYQTRCGLMDCRVWKTARIPPVSLLLLFPPSPPSFSYGPERQRYRRGCEQPAERERLEKLGTTGPIKTNATRGNELHSTHTHIAIFITQVMLGLFFFSSRARLNPPPLPGAPPSKLVFFLLLLLFFRKSCHTDGRCWTLMCGLLSLSISRLSLFWTLFIIISPSCVVSYTCLSIHCIITFSLFISFLSVCLSKPERERERYIYLFPVGVFCTQSIFEAGGFSRSVTSSRRTERRDRQLWTVWAAKYSKWPPNRLVSSIQ